MNTTNQYSNTRKLTVNNSTARRTTNDFDVTPYNEGLVKMWRVIMGLLLIVLPVIFYAIITNL